MPAVELLYWEGCPSHPETLRDLRAALDELGHPEQAITLTLIETEQQAAEHGFIGSPTLRIGGVDPLPPPPDEPTGLTCRVYRRRDGRYSATPDPDDLRDALRQLLPTKED
ncbi:MAG: thioredoxin family protein [Solirubrobacteraceae bacterium]